MCGITGIYGKESSKHIITMMNSLKYRGPDGKGLYINGQIFKSNDINKEFTNILNSNFALGHNLLSIVGENRLQPLKFNNIILVSNAEIYNYKDLVKKYNLSYEDYYSDSEVLLELINYFYTGNLLEAVKKTINIIDADYAFCVYDGIDYIVVRDPVGVKPLYYSYDDDSFAFASEKVALYNIGFSDIFDLNPRTYIFITQFSKSLVIIPSF